MIKAFANLLCIYLVSGLIFCSFSQTNPWKKLQSPVNSTLRTLSFTDSLTGWAAGENGVILHTTDGGLSWESQNSTLQTFLTDIFFSDDMNGWALSIKDVFPFNTIILKTNDGGSNWVAEDFQDLNALMRTIFFFDSLNGFIGGSYIASHQTAVMPGQGLKLIQIWCHRILFMNLIFTIVILVMHAEAEKMLSELCGEQQMMV